MRLSQVLAFVLVVVVISLCCTGDRDTLLALSDHTRGHSIRRLEEQPGSRG